MTNIRYVCSVKIVYGITNSILIRLLVPIDVIPYGLFCQNKSSPMIDHSISVLQWFCLIILLVQIWFQTSQNCVASVGRVLIFVGVIISVRALDFEFDYVARDKHWFPTLLLGILGSTLTFLTCYSSIKYVLLALLKWSNRSDITSPPMVPQNDFCSVYQKLLGKLTSSDGIGKSPLPPFWEIYPCFFASQDALKARVMHISQSVQWASES